MTWSIGSELFWLTSFIGAIVVTLLYEHSPAFRYRFKFVTYIFLVSTVALCMIPFCLFRPKDVRNILIGVPFVRGVSRLIGIRWKISGKEILEKDFPCVVISNHQSMLDILAIVELWPTMKKCACIAKKEVLYVFPFGLMAWLCGTVYINRRNSNQSQMKISTSAKSIRENKTKMWIFPEGTRAKNGEIMPFKKGAFHIAMMHKLPIVPVIVSPYHFIDDDTNTFDSGTMKIKVLDPIDTSNLQYPEDVSKLVEKCHELMNLEFKKMIQPTQKTTRSAEYCKNEIDDTVSNGFAAKVNDPNEGVGTAAQEKFMEESRRS